MSNTLYELEQFVFAFNSGDFLYNRSKLAELTSEYLDEVKASFSRQFINQAKREHIGLSEIGKPAILLGLKAIGAPGEVINAASKLRFHFGDVFETLIVNLLKAYGMKVTDEQMEIRLEGVPGHIDGILNNDTVLEIKTMSDRYYQKFIKEPDDERGYLTQLNLYAHLTGKKGVWLCLNKATYELAFVPMVVNHDALERAQRVIKVLKEVRTIKDVIDNFDPPEPVVEFFKKQPTGRYLVPDSMKYTPYMTVFYNTVLANNGYKKPTVYVEDYANLDESIDRYFELTKDSYPF